MKIVKGQTALLTGASRGLGVYMAGALAEKGMNLVLAARSAEALERVRKEMEGKGVQALAVPTDVADRSALERLVEQATAAFGSLDVLVNNAGIEFDCAYDRLSLDEIEQMIHVNLTSAMLLTRLVLPGMHERNEGHIVNISSMAGVLPTPFGEPYAASKYGLVGFTYALRLSEQHNGSAVSASVVCPGFMDDAGMYEDSKQQYGLTAPPIVGSLGAAHAAKAVVQAIERDLADVMVTPGLPRLFRAWSAVTPRIFERTAQRLGAYEQNRALAARRTAERAEGQG